ncbi:MAG TPA: MbcA/ParS/Xre antitoxin family protein, partial [Crenalkalicoccus sp.]|nr:MbcA/ParS/Xre antitoxin family protein [Crenalkalicoccus sp.]
LGEVLGLSDATISRLASGTYTLDPGSKPYELALLLVRLFRSLDAMVGGEEEPMRSWMRAPNAALAGIPADKVRTVTGLVETVAHVDAARARI